MCLEDSTDSRLVFLINNYPLLALGREVLLTLPKCHTAAARTADASSLQAFRWQYQPHAYPGKAKEEHKKEHKMPWHLGEAGFTLPASHLSTAAHVGRSTINGLAGSVQPADGTTDALAGRWSSKTCVVCCRRLTVHRAALGTVWNAGRCAKRCLAQDNVWRRRAQLVDVRWAALEHRGRAAARLGLADAESLRLVAAPVYGQRVEALSEEHRLEFRAHLESIVEQAFEYQPDAAVSWSLKLELKSAMHDSARPPLVAAAYASRRGYWWDGLREIRSLPAEYASGKVLLAAARPGESVRSALARPDGRRTPVPRTRAEVR